MPKYFAAVCMGNKDRSPMIQGLLAIACKYADIEAHVESFGVLERILSDESKTASDHAKTIVRNAGGDIGEHVRRHITEVDLSRYDAFIVVNRGVAEVLCDAGVNPDRMYIMCEPDGLSDPHDQSLAVFESCSTTICKELQKFLAAFG